MNDLQTNKLDEISETAEAPFDLAKALKLYYKNGLSYQAISDHMGVPRSTIAYRLSKLSALLPNPEELEAYRQNKAIMIEGAELKILNKLLDEETIKGASLNNAAYTYQSLYNCHRLESGKSTSNINVVEVTGTIEDLQTQAQRLRDSL